MSSSSEESTSSESEEETVDGEDKNTRKRGLPEGAPRIASGALIEGEDDEELRSVVLVHIAAVQQLFFFLYSLLSVNQPMP